MNLRQLEYFAAIAEEHTISAAAQRLGIAQPPLSQQLKNLEAELGLTLFERSSRGMRLTPAGDLLYQRAGQILSLTDQTRREMDRLRQGERPLIRLGMISSCGVVFLSAALRDFCATHPEVEFQVTEGNTYELLDALHEDRIDLAVVRTPCSLEACAGFYLALDGMAACRAADCGAAEDAKAPAGQGFDLAPVKNAPEAAASPEIVGLEALAQEPLIIYRRMERLVRDAFAARELSPQFRCMADDARTALMWARAGMGTAIVPASIAEVFGPGSLSLRLIDEPGLTTRTAVVYRRGSLLTRAEEEFLQIFAEKEPLR